MSQKIITLVVSAVVVTLTMGAFVAWVRRKDPVSAKTSRSRALVAFVSATIILGTSMTMFGRYFGASSPLFAATLTMVTLGWTAFANDVVAMRLPARVRRIRPWELRPFPYRTLGVAAFGRFLRKSVVRHLNPSVYLRAAEAQPEYVRAQLETAETVHFWAVVFSFPFLLFACVQGWWAAAVAIVTVHVPVNLYPICHLRLARARLAGYLDKTSNRLNRPTTG